MRSYLIKFLLAGLLLPFQIQAQHDRCPELLKNESDLNRVFELSQMVFIARIKPRNNLNRQIFDFERYEPVLKGDVPVQGFVTFAEGCYPRAEDAIYMFLLNSVDEKIEGFNAVFFSLPDGGPGFNWIADWVELKMKSGARSQKTE